MLKAAQYLGLAVTIIIVALSNYISSAEASRRAFVIGISDYSVLDHLNNASQDAVAIKNKLEGVGFETTIVLDREASRNDLNKRWSSFLKSVERGDEVVVFYSGHGIEIKGKNFIIPSDSPKAGDIGTESAAGNFLLSLSDLMVQLEDLEVRVQVWIIDACRENPFKDGTKSIGVPSGLGNQVVQPGQFVLFSANYGQFAKDRIPSDPPAPVYVGSPFVRKFIEMFDANKRVDVKQFAFLLRRNVADLVKPHPQFPATMEMLFEPWCFETCESGLQSINVASKGGVVASSFSGIEVVEPALKRSGQFSNAVFLGKKEALERCSRGISDAYPFGCEIRNLLFKPNPQDRSKMLETLGPIVAHTNVNIRRKIPDIFEQGPKFACVVRILGIGSKIKLTAVAELTYSGDVYYWGLVDGDPKPCLHELDADASKSAIVKAAWRFDEIFAFCSNDAKKPASSFASSVKMPDGKVRGNRSAQQITSTAKALASIGQCDTAISWFVECMAHDVGAQQLIRENPAPVCARLKDL